MEQGSSWETNSPLDTLEIPSICEAQKFINALIRARNLIRYIVKYFKTWYSFAVKNC